MNGETLSFSLLELFNMGGIFMWPLLLFSVCVVTISLERIIFLASHNLRMDDLAEKTGHYIEEKDWKGASEFLEKRKRRAGARILRAIVNRAMPAKGTLSEHRLEKAAETEAMTCINSLEKGFNFLTALGSLSPLTGFLGTVSGMIGAFRSIAEATEVNAQIVANGIYEALITTVFGLIIAIIAMVAHSVFSHIVDSFAARVEETCSTLIAAIMDAGEQAAGEAPRGTSEAPRGTSEAPHGTSEAPNGTFEAPHGASVQ